MWRANEYGRLFTPGKPLSQELRPLIIGNIIKNGGDPETGVFPGKFVDIARHLSESDLQYIEFLRGSPCKNRPLEFRKITEFLHTFCVEEVIHKMNKKR